MAKYGNFCFAFYGIWTKCKYLHTENLCDHIKYVKISNKETL